MQGFLDPAILFFLFGMFAGVFKSNLEIPPQISRFLSLYLLMALGLKGGFALAKSGIDANVFISLSCAVLLAIVVPFIAYRILKNIVSGYNAAAIAATYGSVSAVTFITATQILESKGILFGGHMAAAMALMESPAIIIAIVFANKVRQQDTSVKKLDTKNQFSMGKLLHESFTDGAQLLLLGALLIGLVTGESGQAVMKPFSVDLFKGLLAFFLLDMGLLAARNLTGLKGHSFYILAYAIVGPMFHAALALGLGLIMNLAIGDTVLLMVLASSASYIAVPAVVRYAIPESNPAFYIGMPLAITFPLNIIFGIPLYIYIANHFIH